MTAAIGRNFSIFCASLGLMTAASSAYAVTTCKGAVVVVNHSLRLIPFDNAKLTVQAKHTIVDAKADRTVVVGAPGIVHHSRDGEKRTTHFQFLHQFAPGTARTAEDTKQVSLQWCSDKSPCQIDQIEVGEVSCSEFGK